ncbi:hypothetical protein KAU09_03365 [Candidatus Parcubacteria bacterium]|nr:hypothetical protein [Candidatus Parcubacteria bacterium]
MINLNILPKKIKNDIKLIIFDKFIKKITGIIFLFIIIFSGILFAAKFYLHLYFEETIEKNASTSKSTEDYLKKVKEINNKIDYITKIQNNNIDWTNTILHISKAINNNIKINKININKSDNTLSLSGNAKTRDSLLLLKNSFEKYENFSEIKIPIKNLLEKNDIDFEITTTINSYEFK